MFSSRQPVFLGEAYKFSPNPLHKTVFQEYKPREIPTHDMPIKKVEYPYANMRFDHLKTFFIPHSNFEHPHFKGLDIHTVKKEKYDAEIEHLGIKDEMEKPSGPNEVKIQMGLGKNEGVPEFAIKNLQQEAGTENTLSRHRDELNFENTTALPFEKQYLEFLDKKQDDVAVNQHLNDKIAEVKERKISKETKNSVIKALESRKQQSNRKKTTVQNIIIPPPPPPPVLAKRAYKKREPKKIQGDLGFVDEEVKSIESDNDASVILEKLNKIMKTPIKRITPKTQTEKNIKPISLAN